MYHKCIALDGSYITERKEPSNDKLMSVERALAPRYRIVKTANYPLLIRPVTKVDSEKALGQLSSCPVSTTIDRACTEPGVKRKKRKGYIEDQELFKASKVICSMVYNYVARVTGREICLAVDREYLSPYALDWYIDTIASSQYLLKKYTTTDEFRERIAKAWPQWDKWSYEKNFRQGSYLGSDEARDLVQLAANNHWYVMSDEALRLARQQNKQAIMVNIDEHQTPAFNALVDNANAYLDNIFNNDRAAADGCAELLFMILKMKIKEQHGEYVSFLDKNMPVPSRALIYKFFYNAELYTLSLQIEPRSDGKLRKEVDAITMKVRLKVLNKDYTCEQEYFRDTAAYAYNALLKCLTDQRSVEQLEKVFQLFQEYFIGFTFKVADLLSDVKA